MTARIYTYAATLAWGGDIQTGEAEVECTYTVDPGRPARGPSYSSGGEPAEPAMVEDITITKVDGRPWTKEEAFWDSFGLTFAEATETLCDKLIWDCEPDMLNEAWEQDCADRDAWDEMRQEDARNDP